MSLSLQSASCRSATLAIMLVAGLLMARADAAEKKSAKQPEGTQVEMFEAMQAGDIDVKFIPKSEFEARVQIVNKTNKPLSVKLPEAFAATPVLAQRNSTSSSSSNNSQNQGVGGGFGGGGGGFGGGGGGGFGGGGGGGGFFNVPAEKVGQLKVATVCLEHGKKVPRAGIAYEIKPIDSFTTKTEVQELCKLVGYRHFSSQRAAQAAAWHLANDMSWEQLAAKQVEHLNAPSEPYFSQQELREALQISGAAETEAKKQPIKSASEKLSVSEKK